MSKQEYMKEYHKKYRQTFKGKEVLSKASLKYRQSPYGKTKRKLYNEKYRSTKHGHIQHLFANIRWRCGQKNIPFDLNLEYLENLYEKQQGRCSISNKAMTFGRSVGRQKTAAGVDRIIPKKGYTKENIRFVCDGVNMMRNDMNDKELECWCIDIIEGFRGNANRPIPNVSTIADILDRLIVELMKLSFFEQNKRDEQFKEFPDSTKIALYDDMSREACEYRSALKNMLNENLKEIVRTKSYSPVKELRTFRPPSRSIAEIVEEMVSNNQELKKEFSETLEYELKELDED